VNCVAIVERRSGGRVAFSTLLGEVWLPDLDDRGNPIAIAISPLCEPGGDRVTGRLGDFEWNRLTGFLLDERGA
jgi:hypothetical protein